MDLLWFRRAAVGLFAIAGAYILNGIIFPESARFHKSPLVLLILQSARRFYDLKSSRFAPVHHRFGKSPSTEQVVYTSPYLGSLGSENPFEPSGYAAYFSPDG